MKFIYPPIKNLSPAPNTKNVTLEDILNDANFSNDLGSFIIGKNKTFHGGINLVVPNGHGLQAVADGRIVAYRVSKASQKINHANNKDGSITSLLEFSNNFILVEHDFDKFEYLKFIDGEVADNPYKGYKFYTLYMHIMPLDECNNMLILPDWLVLNRELRSNPILRGEKLSPNVLSFNQGFTIAEVVSKGTKIKISQSDVVNINNESYLNKKLEWYDSSTEQVKILEKFFTSEDVIVLNDTTTIPVQAGELIGYAGKSQASNIDQSLVNFMHFEVWLDSQNFLSNNINNQYASYISDSAPDFSTQKKALFNNLNKRSLGHAYVKSQSDYTFESLSFEIINSKTPLYINVRGKSSFSLMSGEATQFLNSILSNTVRTLYTDADWLNSPMNQWSIKMQSDFFNEDGSIKEVDYKTKYSNPISWKKLQSRAIIKLTYSEWDKKYFEQKYNFLLTKKSKYFSKLDKNTFETLKKYQESLSFLDKTTASSLIPKVENIHVINPIEFLAQLKRCMLPAPPTANTHLVKRLVQYALDENVYLVKILLKKMDNWIRGGTDVDLDAKFYLWFGYKRGVISRTTATSIVYSDGKTPPNVTDFNIARKIVCEHLVQAFKILKNTNYEKLCFGWGLDAGAFVYPSDLNHNIHLGFQMFPLSAVDNSNQVNTIENFSVPLFRRTKTGDVGFVNCILHEALHFVIKNSDIKNQSIVSSMYEYDNNHKYLNDIKIDYIDQRSKSIEFVSYGLDICKKLAIDIPSATLANSDNFAEFFAEVMEGIRPTIQYRNI